MQLDLLYIYPSNALRVVSCYTQLSRTGVNMYAILANGRAFSAVRSKEGLLASIAYQSLSHLHVHI